MTDRYYILDEFLLKLQISQKYLGIVYFDFKRKDHSQPFRFKSMLMLYVAITILIFDGVCYIIKTVLEIRANRLIEAKQVGAVFSIELLCLVRGISLLLQYPKMLALTNDLDKIFPKSRREQARMNVNAFAKYLEMRHRMLHVHTILGLSAFFGIPLVKYWLFYDRDSGEALSDEYHQHPSWFPYQLKTNPRTYPYMYVYETIISVLAINCLFTWDHIYTVSMVQFAMHFDFVNDELQQLNAKETLMPNDSTDFYKRLNDIIKYHQHILLLGNQLRKTFNLSLFMTDIISAASICFHVYLIANSKEIISVVMFTFPCFVQVMFTFDNCYQGTRVAEASARMLLALSQQNWYDGSLEYRKLFNILMQFSNNNFTLSGFSSFTTDMIHFRGTMMIAYRMFTFLQSRGNSG